MRDWKLWALGIGVFLLLIAADIGWAVRQKHQQATMTWWDSSPPLVDVATQRPIQFGLRRDGVVVWRVTP